ncbi:MAG TPA: class I SAM-dependent methyltransferase [Ktedonobacteraceae bacterium]|nr:class I SAM-dependent methyltransferase [Ktedonobacteraceae bacterium]
MTTQQTIDQAKADAFVSKVLADTAALAVTTLSSIGDRLGLFKNLAEQGPATSEELAERAHINERYAREWLSAMACAGYLEYDPVMHRFTLPIEHFPVLAQEGGPVFFGGVQEEMVGLVGPINQLMQAFRIGGGVPMEAYDPSTWEGVSRFSSGWFENLLVPVWLPAMPDVLAKLEYGALVADVGCGQGKALIKLAQTYPQSRYVGYDNFAPSIEQARANAEAAGVTDRVRFEHRDLSTGLPEQYDVITTFDVVHDAVSPRSLLQAIHDGLRPDGRYVCLEINSSDKLEENMGLLGAFFYSCSVLYCMTTSLAHHGEGLGTTGVTETKMRELCAEAGFSNVRRVPMENPFNILYEVIP